MAKTEKLGGNMNSTFEKDLAICSDSIIDKEILLNKSILITGATGLIGSFIVEELLYLNQVSNFQIQVIALGRNSKRLKERFSEYLNDEKLVLIEQDITEPFKKELSNLHVDYVIHAASNAFPKAFKEDPVGTMQANLNGTDNLLAYSVANKVKRFLFVSTGEVYGVLDKSKAPFTEELSGFIDFTDVRSCYPSSKRAAETLVVSYVKQYDLDCVSVRPSHIFGANYTRFDNRASVQFFENVKGGQDIILKSLATNLRTYCYIVDCVSSLLTVLIKGEKGEVYNLTNTTNKVTLANFAEEIAKYCNRQVKFELGGQKETSEKTPIEIAVLSDKKVRELGWKPYFSLDLAIEHIFKLIEE